jgi:spore maturation protein CgeB
MRKDIAVSFVGLLGTNVQMHKTLLMESVAARHPFHWWGPKGPLLDSFPNLTKTWQGVVAGKEMYEVYQRSKIVVNDYVITANSDGVNMRLKEVMSTGSFLLTRFAENIRFLEEANALKTFTTEAECSQLIKHYLLHEEEREQIAATGYTYVRNHFGSSTVMEPVITAIAEALEKKRAETNGL